MMSKLLSFEKGFEKLEKLDKLDSIETCVRNMSLKLNDFEQRLERSEKTTIELTRSVSFVSAQYDEVSVTCAQSSSKLSKVDNDVAVLAKENVELKKYVIKSQ